MAARRLFGTDGMRARFGEPPLVRETVTSLGCHLARFLADQGSEPRLVMGGDTRASTSEICSWLAAGLAAAGASVRYVGVLPTPAIARLTATFGWSAGIAVSASHNPWNDNGIKLLRGDGFKWPEEDEAALERLLEQGLGDRPLPDPELPAVADVADRYLDLLAATVDDERPLSGLSVVLDTANGAASAVAPRLFRRLGASVTVLHDQPDGHNINRGCGSTHPEALARRTAAAAADLGIAFDGDADRALLVDETGRLRDGDAMLYLWALELLRAGALDPRRIVATSMSNLGLERALAAEGIGVVRCGVGDREVVETMRREGILLGGEQSGHLVHLGLGTTGDGLLTGLQLAASLHRSGRTLSDLLRPFKRYPQVLKSVRVNEKPDLRGLPTVRAAEAHVQQRLGEDGRLVLRYSGTEPLARVMIEGPDAALIEGLADELIAAIRSEIGTT